MLGKIAITSSARSTNPWRPLSSLLGADLHRVPGRRHRRAVVAMYLPIFKSSVRFGDLIVRARLAKSVRLAVAAVAARPRGSPQAVAASVGLLVGRFLNVVIHRLPKMLERGWQDQCAELRGETPRRARATTSCCRAPRAPSCGHQITAAENIPVLSWLMLRGKCSQCGTPISTRYPVVETAGRDPRGGRDLEVRSDLAGPWPHAPSSGRSSRLDVHRLRHAAPARRS
jgi:hypothetical protein